MCTDPLTRFRTTLVLAAVLLAGALGTANALRPYGFLDGWAATPGTFEGDLVGDDLDPAAQLALVHEDSGVRIPLTVIEARGADTLRVRAELQEEGGYRLEAGLGDEVFNLPHAVHLGPAATLRVPGDFKTIQEALDAAPPYAWVAVDPGTYVESVTIAKPVRLRGEGKVWENVIRPRGGARGIHVLASSGPLTELIRFHVAGPGFWSDSTTAGPGAGILAESPVLVSGCEVEGFHSAGSSARGGGIAAAPGSRITGNRICGCGATSDPSALDPFSEAAGAGGNGGGLFCLDCLVDGNEISGNFASTAGGIVASGLIRRNTIRDNGAIAPNPPGGGWGSAALRGRIEANHFDAFCFGSRADVLIDGPADAERNRFTFLTGDLCAAESRLQLRGSVRLLHNTLVGWSLDAWLSVDPAREPAGGALRVSDNLLRGDAMLWTDPGFDPAFQRADTTGRVAIPADSLRFGCNLATGDVLYVDPWNYVACDSCADHVAELRFCETRYLTDDHQQAGNWDLRVLPGSPAIPGFGPAACADTIGALGKGCEATPVLLEAHGVERVEAGLRIYWQIPLGISVTRADLMREADGALEIIAANTLSDCRPCAVVDAAPPEAERIVYTLALRLVDGSREDLVLGEWTGGIAPPARLSLAPPRPQPARDAVEIAFAVPRAGRVGIALFDIAGRRAACIADREYGAGTHRIAWAPRDRAGRPLASGVYWLRIEAAGAKAARRVVVLR